MPVIMLTARDAVMDKVSGLDAGADDYITKPFAIEELLARIRVVFKKRGTDRNDSKHVCKVTPMLSAKGVTLDEDRHEVMCIRLAIEEVDLLCFIFAAPFCRFPFPFVFIFNSIADTPYWVRR